jgi:prepilin-type N-terminal cleavage/methylation domain-containing protein
MTTDDEGFTLIELLIAIAIMGLMLGAITSAMIVAFRTVDARRQTVTDSSGAQLLVSYLVADVQAADRVQPTDFRCDAASLLELRSTDADASLNRMTVTAYAVSTGPSGGSQLSRDVYTLNSAATTCAGIVASRRTLVQDIDSTATAVKCDGGATCNNTSIIVGLHVAAYSIQPKGNEYVPYTFDISGTRRTK